MPSWANHFPDLQPGKEPVVVEKALGTFTMEREAIRVNTTLCSSLNVEHRVLMGKLFG